MTNKCFNCSSKTNLHKLPQVPEIRLRWEANVPNATPEDFRKGFWLCAAHFDKKYITLNGRLFRTNRPTRFIDKNGLFYTVDEKPSIPIVPNLTEETQCKNRLPLGENKKNKTEYPDKISNSQQSCDLPSPSENPLSCIPKAENITAFRYIRDIDPSANYSSQTTKKTLSKCLDHIRKLRQSHKILQMKHYHMKNKIEKMENFLADLAKRGVICKQSFAQFNAGTDKP